MHARRGGGDGLVGASNMPFWVGLFGGERGLSVERVGCFVEFGFDCFL